MKNEEPSPDTTGLLRSGFPQADPRRHAGTIPACVSIGLEQMAIPGGPTGAWLDLGLPVTRDRDGRISRGAALILADQAAAAGVHATLAAPQPMMTLDLRVDWHGAIPVADRLDCIIDEAVREGELCTARGTLMADAAHRVGSVVARFLIGAMPGGRVTDMPTSPAENGPSRAASFEEAMRVVACDGGWRVEPDPAMVGARAVPAFHGGFVAAVLEHAAGTIAAPHQPVDLEIRYLRPARADAPLFLTARAVQAGRRASVIEAEARQGEDGTVVAAMRALFLAHPRAPAVAHRLAAN